MINKLKKFVDQQIIKFDQDLIKAQQSGCERSEMVASVRLASFVSVKSKILELENEKSNKPKSN